MAVRPAVGVLTSISVGVVGSAVVVESHTVAEGGSLVAVRGAGGAVERGVRAGFGVGVERCAVVAVMGAVAVVVTVIGDAAGVGETCTC